MALLLVIVSVLSACSTGDGKISKEEFKQIENGMSMKEVEKIVGGKGEESVNQYNPSLVEYKYPALDGVEEDGYVYILFSDSRVDVILDFGLLQKKEDNITKDTAKPEQETAPMPAQSIEWEEKIKEVSSGGGTTTEKFDEISKYAHDYKPSQAEVKQFGDDIIKEYKDKNYIKDVSNHEYMLSNIFKSQVVDKNASEKPLKNFAFDFWQNSKYNYRGVENTTSSATQANERQMDKALNKMNK
ncbi:hypothetical protein COK37_29770 [Bacillus thuringiensis]|uniref:hypothetical protein n=1 Tax=Bacillus cereus group TaxID=86661 RepID=UPI000BF9B936|nr:MULTISPECIES: hypothetical protein [Bacillus cereus group]PEV53900.1 hypothetical protein CN432_00615 [Bacillus thuringiensis]PFL27462.1 hypothetical protein COJ22_01770 [Bacillus cereus]PFR63572.1 hypothetical protein COK37_29770 [Bacillus thuringiensis]PFT79530.1 hypothetical protein COK70_15570 [Bacillus thuringiensis]PGP40667.1 hypothetical protein CN993_24885 [Bacillus thuringiensis]